MKSIYFEKSKLQISEVVVFISATLVLLLSLIAQPLTWNKIKWPLGIKNVPSLDLSKYLFNKPCPTCGLTRSFVHMAHLHIFEAFKIHFLGPPLFLLTIIAFIYLTYRVLGGKHRIVFNLSNKAIIILIAVIVSLFLIAWIAKLVLGYY